MQMYRDLYDTPAEQLDTFGTQELQSSRKWKDKLQDIFNKTEIFFRELCFQDHTVGNKQVKVIKVVKGGAFSKCPDLKQKSSVDLLLFLDCFSSYENQHKLRGTIIEFMKERLKECQKSLAYNIIHISKSMSFHGSAHPRSLRFSIQLEKRKVPIHVDVLPVFNALEKGPCPEVYENLIKNKGHPGEFSPSFSELQRNFTRNRPDKLKSLLQLVKHWYRKHLEKKYPEKHLPPKYALELLTIFAWETGVQKAEDFELAEGFVTVMELLKNYNNICIYWTEYYNFENPLVEGFVKRQLKKKRPVILDPADPTNDRGNSTGWKLVATEASYCLSQACSQRKDRRRISGWNVKGARDIQVTLECPSFQQWTYNVNPYNLIEKMKNDIEMHNMIPIAEQRLSFKEPKGKPQILMGHSTLAQYNIFYQITIQVLVISSATEKIHVRFPDNTNHTYPFQKEDTVLMVKQQIRDQRGWALKKQVLIYKSCVLGHKRRLCNYGIKNGDTLKLNLNIQKRKKGKERKEGKEEDYLLEVED